MQVAHRTLRRLTVEAACITALAGAGFAGFAAAGATSAFAQTTATASTTYSCSLTGILPETEADTLTLTTPTTGTEGSAVDVAIDQPQGTTTSPVAVTSVTISGTATVAGDGSVTTLAFSGTGASSAAGAAPAAVDTTESLTLPSTSGTVTLTLPDSYDISIDLGIYGTESGTCTATSPGSESITVSS